MKTSIILLIILLLISSVCFLFLSKRIKSKQQELKKCLDDIRLAKETVSQLEKEHQDLSQDIEKCKSEYDISLEHFNDIKSLLENEQEVYEQFKDGLTANRNAYVDLLDSAYQKIEEDFDARFELAKTQLDIDLENIMAEKEKALQDLDKIKASLSAGIEAQLREEAKENQIDFYKLHLSKDDYSDVQYLNTIKYNLRQPIILNKLIWSNYFQKQTNELCNRILGAKTVCGIYKITNLTNQRTYIGQSVDIAKR